MPTKRLFEISPHLDRSGAAATFAREGRVQLRNILTDETAREIRTILAEQTPWGLAMQAGEKSPTVQLRARELAGPAGRERARQMMHETHAAAARGDYAFRYGHYPLVQSALEGWDPGGPHDLLLEYLNAPEFMDLVRTVTGSFDLVKADGQATLFAPQHFLGRHNDSHVGDGWKVAYVLNFTIDDWNTDWGGHLQFFDEDGEIAGAFRPRFNALNLLAVPQPHAVSCVAPFAPVGRYAITGWFRDR